MFEGKRPRMKYINKYLIADRLLTGE